MYLQQRSYCGIQVLDTCCTVNESVRLVDEEEVGHRLNVVEHEILGVDACRVDDAYPWQGRGLLLPEVLVGVERHLVYFQSLSMIFVV